jgi:uncharacterized membrane protein
MQRIAILANVRKPNIIGIVGGFLAISSLIFPWWTVSVVFHFMGIDQPAYMSLYLYRADTSALGWSRSSHLNLSFGWVTLALVVFASLFGIAGGLLRRTRMVLIGGSCVIVSMIVFVAALQSELLNGPVVPWGFIVTGVFSSATIDQGYLSSASYTAYLSFGFWIALAAAIILLVNAKYQK